MKKRATIHLCDFHIWKAWVCVSCRAFVFTISVYQLVTNEQQISLRLKICGHFMDIIMAWVSSATPGTLCGLNVIPIQQRRRKKKDIQFFLFVFFFPCYPHSLQIRWVSVPSIILCTSYPYFYVISSGSWDINWACQLRHSLPIFSLSPSFFFLSTTSSSLLIIFLMLQSPGPTPPTHTHTPHPHPTPPCSLSASQPHN